MRWTREFNPMTLVAVTLAALSWSGPARAQPRDPVTVPRLAASEVVEACRAVRGGLPALWQHPERAVQARVEEHCRALEVAPASLRAPPGATVSAQDPAYDDARAAVELRFIAQCAESPAGTPSRRACEAARTRVSPEFTALMHGAASLNAFSPVSEAAALRGTADFLVARAGQEVMLLLRERLVGSLCPRGSTPTLFPQTCRVLRPGGDTSYGDDFSALVGAVREDLTALPVVLFARVYTEMPDGSARLTFCLGALHARVLGEARVESFSGYLGALHRELSAHPPSPVPQPPREGVDGLLDRCAGEPFGAPLKQVIETVDEALAKYQRLPLGDAPGGLEVNAARVDLRATLPPNLQALYDPVSRLLQAADELRHAPGDPAKSRAFARAVVAAVIASVELVPTLADAQHPVERASVTPAVRLLQSLDAWIEGDHATAIRRILEVIEALDAHAAGPDTGARGALREARRYLLLVASVASARDADEVRAALEAAAAPLGSWRAYHRGFAGFLGAQLGVGVGGEFNLQNPIGDGGVVTPTLPIGLSIGGPLGEQGCASWRIFFSVLDLGALVTPRINNAVAQSEARPGQSEGRAVSDEELTLGRAFAPGLFANVSLGRSPVMAFVGAQLSPTLRDYFVCAGASCAAESQPTVRVLAGLSVDVPVFRMF